MKLVDSHSHLFLEDFQSDLPQVMMRAREAGVTHIFMPNIDSTTIEPMLKVCSEYKGYCFPMIGLHPTSVDAGYEKELAVVAGHLAMPDGYVAIGEIGMDLYWDKTYLKEQQIAFERQVRWALEYGLPVVIHCREAFDYIYDILKPYKTSSLRGIFHSFTGTREEAFRMLEFSNFFIGINGVVTFKKSGLPEVLQNIPLGKDDRLAHKVLPAGAFFQQLALGCRQVFQHRSIRKSAFGTPADAFQGRKIAFRHGFRGIISMTKIMFFIFLRKSFPLSSQKTPRDRGVERSCRGGGAQQAPRRGIICAGSFPGPRP